MRKYRPAALFAVVCLGFVLLLATLLQMEASPPQRQSTKVAVVVYGESEERWRAFKQGMQQACYELGIETPAFQFVPEADAKSATRAALRSIENGAEGLLLALPDTIETQDFMAQTTQQLPITLVETGLEGHPAIAANNTQMGRDLAEEVAAQERGGKVLLIQNHQNHQSTRQRYEGFVQRATELGLTISTWSGMREGDDLTEYLATNLASATADALISFDNETLEHAVDAAAQTESGIHLYGVGSSDKIVQALDQQLVEAVCFQNEFNVGYLGVMNLGYQIGLHNNVVANRVEYRLVRPENMYEPDMERLLFPIVE